MIAGVFAAFTFEAYLNHIGKRLPDWENLERTLGHKEKLKLLQKSLGFKADQRRSPYKSIHDIFYLRDSLAHGKTKTSTIDKKVKKHQIGHFEYPQVDLKKLCTLPNVTIMVKNVESMIRLINNQLGSKIDPFAILERSNSYITCLN